MYSSTSGFYAKCCQASSTYKALHDPWCHFLFGLWWVSLAEYLLVLMVYFSHLLQIIQSIMGIVRTASVPPWTRSRPWVRHFYISNLWCFCGMWSQTDKYLNNGVRCWFKKYFASATTYLNLGCNNSFHTQMYVERLVNLCNTLLVCWIMYDLGCVLDYSRSFVMLDGLPGLYGLKYDSATACGCHCTCALINWPVLRQTRLLRWLCRHL